MNAPTTHSAGADISNATIEGYATGLDAIGYFHIAAALRALNDQRSGNAGTDPTDTPDLRARYDVLVKEVKRERDEHARTRAALAAAATETRSLRAALGLAHDAPPAPARNFGGG